MDKTARIFARIRQRVEENKSRSPSSRPGGGVSVAPRVYTAADVCEMDLPRCEKEDDEKLHDTVLTKLRLCTVLFDFSNNDDDDGFFISKPAASSGASLTGTPDEIAEQQNRIGKEKKRVHLIDLVQVMTQRRPWFSERVLVEVLKMFAKNAFRALPPVPYPDWDQEEDEPAREAAWPHIQMVYELFYYFCGSAHVLPRLMYKSMNEDFVLNIMALFHSQDINEREYLKNIIHRIYQKFIGYRPLIRKAISNDLYKFVFETGLHYGVAELLEVAGTIICGLKTPLKDEYKDFLRNVLIPLHKPRNLKLYHQQLGFCVVQMVDKEPALAGEVIGGLLKFWPGQSSEKEQLFITELEELLDLSGRKELEVVMDPLFKQIGKSITSHHFQVAERALFLWNKDVVATITADHRNTILPILFPSITSQHWNRQVNELASNIVRMFKEMDDSLWVEVEEEHQQKTARKEERRSGRLSRWARLEEMGRERALKST